MPRSVPDAQHDEKTHPKNIKICQTQIQKHDIFCVKISQTSVTFSTGILCLNESKHEMFLIDDRKNHTRCVFHVWGKERSPFVPECVPEERNASFHIITMVAASLWRVFAGDHGSADAVRCQNEGRSAMEFRNPGSKQSDFASQVPKFRAEAAENTDFFSSKCQKRCFSRDFDGCL